MRHRFFLLMVALVLAVPVALPAFGQTNRLRDGLDARLARLAPGERTTVVVAFEGTGPISAAMRTRIAALGITNGVTMRNIPVAGLLGTAAQIRAVAALSGVRGVWPNDPVTFYNYDARHLTGVEKLRTDSRLRTAQGMPYSGKGVGVVINDSGIDATLPDLQFGNRVVQNVQALTNLNAYSGLLPITYLENVQNTDTGSGHGTHCAGTVGGSGASSAGRHAGVAPGATLLGYGSGGVLLILDSIGGIDWAITNQARYGIRVVSNSWGSSGPFDPANPVNLASYAAYQRGITVLFAAGNEGPGEDTHNPYAVAPWVISVGAGDKTGRLADFSSRGKRGQTGTFTTADGVEWTFKNEPTLVGPGVDIISARATTGALPALSAEQDVNALGANAAFYSHSSGTSMATPHVAGIVALMLEANPQLQPDDVKRLLTSTATNMPGSESWEAGAGYVNAYDAVVMALGRRTDFGTTLTATQAFNANAVLVPGATQNFSVDFNPVGARDSYTFEVGADVALVTARATVDANTVAIRLTDPNGQSYGSAIALPALGSSIVASAPGVPGTWTLTAGGVGFVSGNDLDPAGVTNGYGLPGTVSGTISFTLSGGYTGVGDIASHPAKGAIEAAVANRLVDGRPNGTYDPDGALTRGDLARFAVWGFGARQSLPLAGGFTFGDVPATLAPYVEATTARGGALRDRFQVSKGMIRTTGGAFQPGASVTRADLAYTLGQALGLQAVAERLAADFAAGRKTMGVSYDGTMVPLSDAGAIPADLKGYVQLALDLGLLNARFALTQGPFDLQPTLTASFGPGTVVTRGAYAVAAVGTLNAFNSGDVAAAYGAGAPASTIPALAEGTVPAGGLAAVAASLDAPYPNPARTSATLRYRLPEAARVRLTVFDALGRAVAHLADGDQAAGTHTATLDVAALPAGLYVSRLEAGQRVETQRLVVVR